MSAKKALEIVEQVGPRAEALIGGTGEPSRKDFDELADLVNGVAVAVRELAQEAEVSRSGKVW